LLALKTVHLTGQVKRGTYQFFLGGRGVKGDWGDVSSGVLRAKATWGYKGREGTIK
jgi:hypothetical protein